MTTTYIIDTDLDPDDLPMVDRSSSETEVALAFAHLRASELANVPAEAAAALGEAESALGTLYNAAEASGDQTGMDAIVVAWNRTQAIHAQVGQLQAAHAAALALAQQIEAKRSAVANELGTLLTALDEVDLANQHVANVADAVQALSEEYGGIQNYDEGFDDGYEQGKTDAEHDEDDMIAYLGDKVADTHGIGYQTAHELLEALIGAKLLTNDKIDLLIEELLRMQRANG